MKLSEIKELLNCKVLVKDKNMSEDEIEIKEVVASDGMSEILAFAKSGELMVTGLTNIQSIRTADIAGIRAVLYCRGKKPGKDVLKLAQEKNIPVLTTKMGMFEICGKLYKAGLKGVS